jgi:hypothetical protein
MVKGGLVKVKVLPLPVTKLHSDIKIIALHLKSGKGVSVPVKTTSEVLLPLAVTNRKESKIDLRNDSPAVNPLILFF